MVSSEYAKTAGIIRDRFVKTKLSREIGDRILDRASSTGLSVSLVSAEIFFEFLKNLLQLAEKSSCPVRVLPIWIAAKAAASGRGYDLFGSKGPDPDDGIAGARQVPTSTTD